MKKILSIVLTAVLLVSLAGCGSEGGVSTSEKNSLGINYVTKELSYNQFDIGQQKDRTFSVKFDIIDLKNEHFKSIINQEYLDYIDFDDEDFQEFTEDNDIFEIQTDEEEEWNSAYQIQFNDNFGDFDDFPLSGEFIAHVGLGFNRPEMGDGFLQLDESMTTYDYFDIGFEFFDYWEDEESDDVISLPESDKIFLSSEYKGDIQSPALNVYYTNNEHTYGEGKLPILTPEASEFFASGDFIRNVEFKDLTK